MLRINNNHVNVTTTLMLLTAAAATFSYDDYQKKNGKLMKRKFITLTSTYLRCRRNFVTCFSLTLFS